MTQGKTTFSKFGRRLSLPIRDFLAGFVAFGVLAGPGVLCPELSCTVVSSSAHAHIQAADQMGGIVSGMLAGPVVAGPHGIVALISLSLAFASLVALNLWIARHVRRVHATYRRRR